MHLKKTPKLENDLELQVKLSKKSTKVHFAVSLCGPNHERYCSECLFARDSSYTRPPSSPAALRKLPCLDTSLTLTEHAGSYIFPGTFLTIWKLQGNNNALNSYSASPQLLYKKSGLLKHSVEDEESKNLTAWI